MTERTNGAAWGLGVRRWGCFVIGASVWAMTARASGQPGWSGITPSEPGYWLGGALLVYALFAGMTFDRLLSWGIFVFTGYLARIRVIDLNAPMTHGVLLASCLVGIFGRSVLWPVKLLRRLR
jgi:hypothetical protein